MNMLYLFLLALIQGITEFLPVSSSGHLILLPKLLSTEDQGVMLDVAVHVGTLGAVMLYFWRDMLKLLVGVGHVATGRFTTEPSKLFLLLCFATIPVILFGLLLKLSGLMHDFRSMEVIGWTMLVFGIALYIADRNGGEVKTSGHWNWKDATVMGFAQAIALIPGTSRSGITITAARGLGYTRAEAARLSMLMSVPTILASGALLGKDVIETGDWRLLGEAGIAAGLAFVAALLALSLMMRLLKSISFTPYVIYRIGLGGVLLYLAYS